MFNFKKIKEAIKKVTSAILTASLSIGMFSATPIKAMEGFNDYDCEIFMIGDTQSGKTQIINRMVINKFKENCKATIGMDFFRQEYSFNNNQHRVRFWDTVDKEESLSESFGMISISKIISKIDAIILAVSYSDVADVAYGKSIVKWLDFAEKTLESSETSIKNSEKVPVKVVLTKCDMANEEERKSKKEDVENYLSNISEETYKKLEINKTVIETSAKDNTGINYKKGELRNPETCL